MHYSAITDRLRDTGGAKWAIHQRSREMRRAGVDIVEMTIGEPDTPTDPKLIEVASNAMKAGRVRYSNGRGEPELVDALVQKYSKRRTGVTAENILCFPGTQTALFATMMALTEGGVGVLVGDPFYATYEGVIRASGAHPVSVPLRAENGFRMQLADLARAHTPECKVLLLNAPHNPSGAVLDAKAVSEVGAFCEKHNLWLVCDEVYEDLIFDGLFHSPFDIPAYARHVIALSSISKSCAAPGFRSGWAVGPAEFCERLLPVSETMLFGNQPFIADMTAYALNNPPDTPRVMRRNYQRRAQVLVEALSGVTGLQPYMPESGMFLLVDVSQTGRDGDAFAWGLLDAGVAVMPGTSFGASAGDLVRLSLTVPDDLIAKACDRIATYSETL